MSARIPAEVFRPGIFLQEEMDARGWSDHDVAIRMGGITEKETIVNELSVQALREGWVFPDDPDPEIGPKMAEELGTAFGTSADFWLNLDRAWHQRANGK